LTTDDDDEMAAADRIKEESPSPGWSEPAESTKTIGPVRPPNPVFDDYLFRSRRKASREMAPPVQDNWQTWDWSELTTPVWVVATYPDIADHEETEERASDDVHTQEQPRAVTVTLSPLRDIPC
jgi:hypothetical protein